MTRRTPERPKEPGTPEQILDVAERFVQTRGFHGFSYADIAAELGVTKPALHYHFPNKATLGQALVARYGERFARALVEAERSHTGAAAQLEAFTQLYVDVIRQGRMCLCGMLAAEYQTLPAPVRRAVMEFFEQIETWLADVLERGRDDRTLRVDSAPSGAARLIVSELEGAMLVARLHDDPALFDDAVRRLLDSFHPRAGASRGAARRAR